MSDNGKADCPTSQRNKQRKITLDSPTPWKWVNLIIIVIIPSISLIVALISFWYVRQSNLRAEKLFGSQITPLIQERPLGLLHDQHTDLAQTEFEIVNYSGFDAFEITWDLKYGANDWIVQWVKAEIDRLQKLNRRTPQEEERLKELSKMPFGIVKLRAGERNIRYALTGSLSLDEVCSNREGIEVLTRITWKNEKRHTFEPIRKFRLLCTKVGSGSSLAFFPQGTITQEE